MNSDDAVVALLLGYLDEAEMHGRGWVISHAPLQQPVTVHRSQWEELLVSDVLHDDVRNGVRAALDLIATAGDRVDRRMLTAASRRIAASDASRVSCWFLVMTWGAGPQDRSRLRQWRKAIPAPRFLSSLADSVNGLADGRLADAYRGSKLPGVGESYLTKWLWAAGLAMPAMPVRPAVLDARVWRVLHLLRWVPAGRNRAERWVDYCASLERWARLLKEERPSWTVDSDRLEQLFFDRDRKIGTPFVDLVAGDQVGLGGPRAAAGFSSPVGWRRDR